MHLELDCCAPASTSLRRVESGKLYSALKYDQTKMRFQRPFKLLFLIFVAVEALNLKAPLAINSGLIYDQTLNRLVSESLPVSEHRLAIASSRCWSPHQSHPDSCLLYTSPSPRDKRQSRMPSSA